MLLQWVYIAAHFRQLSQLNLSLYQLKYMPTNFTQTMLPNSNVQITARHLITENVKNDDTNANNIVTG